jgi:hypothetical protein
MQALMIQCASFLLLLVALKSLWLVAGVKLGLTVVISLQGIIAAVITRWRGLALWWSLIQLLLPIALLTTHSLHFPPSIFLVAFVFLLGCYWTTFRTQVPFYPSNPLVWNAVSTLLPPDRSIKFIDIGSGLGGPVLNLAARRPDSTFVGIELAPLPWLVSRFMAVLIGSRASFIRGDYENQHFSHYDVVFAYLSPVAMMPLWAKARAEMRSGTLLLSYEFPVDDAPPQIAMVIELGGPLLYGWRF